MSLGLVVRGAITALLFIVTVTSIRAVLVVSFEKSYDKEHLIVDRCLIGAKAPASVVKAATSSLASPRNNEDPLDRIQRCRVIRIGFYANRLPFSYFNRVGDLVGFDINMAHRMARDLGVRIEFVRLSGDMIAALRADHCDVVMSGQEGTIDRATALPAMEPYMTVTRALVVPDYQRAEFSSLTQLKKAWRGRTLRLAIVLDGAGRLQPIHTRRSVRVGVQSSRAVSQRTSNSSNCVTRANSSVSGRRPRMRW